MDWYKRFMGDYAKDTASLRMIEHGAYTLLLDFYYSTGAALPAEKQEIYRITKAFERWEIEAVDRVLAKFFTLTGAGYKQKRAEAELANYEKAAEKYRANGKKHLGSNLVPKRGDIPDTRYQKKIKDRAAKPAASRSHFLPDDFELTALRMQWAADRGIPDIALEFAKFHSYHKAKGSRFVDWDAAWRTWVLNYHKYASSREVKDGESRAAAQVGRGPDGGGLSEEYLEKVRKRKAQEFSGMVRRDEKVPA